VATFLRDLEDRARLVGESRAFSTVELRAENDGSVTFDGIASVVDKAYEVHDSFGSFAETMAKGAFRKSIAEKADVRLLVNHDGVPLARTKSKTLTLTSNPDLRAVAKLDAANPRVQEVRSAMDRGDLDQMSIGFRVTRQEWNGDYTERTIREVELFDVSVVTFPASPTTTAQLRTADELIASLRNVEMSGPEVRRAIKTLERRFADVYSEEVETWLLVALQERFGDMCISIEDFTDSVVVYSCTDMGMTMVDSEDDDDADLYQLGYTLAGHTVTLADTDPVAVVEVSTYEPTGRSTSGFDYSNLLALWDKRRQPLTL